MLIRKCSIIVCKGKNFKKRKIMAWLLSGIMMLHPVAGVQAAEFSDEVVGYFRI